MDGFVEVCASLESNGGLERQVLAQILLVSSTASNMVHVHLHGHVHGAWTCAWTCAWFLHILIL